MTVARRLDILSVIGFWSLLAGYLAIYGISWSWHGFILAFFLADIISGYVHWFADSFFHQNTPIIGKYLIFPFREHHQIPQKITQHDFFETTGNPSRKHITKTVNVR